MRMADVAISGSLGGDTVARNPCDSWASLFYPCLRDQRPRSAFAVLPYSVYYYYYYYYYYEYYYYHYHYHYHYHCYYYAVVAMNYSAACVDNWPACACIIALQ